MLAFAARAAPRAVGDVEEGVPQDDAIGQGDAVELALVRHAGRQARRFR